MVALSHDDKFIVEVVADSTGATILMRNVVQNQIVAKFEGHSQQIQSLNFSQSSYDFVSSAGNECLLWECPAFKNEQKI